MVEFISSNGRFLGNVGGFDFFEFPSTKKLGLLSEIERTESEGEEFISLLSTLERLDDERYRGIDRSEIHELEAKITEAAWKLEDVIGSYELNSQGVDEEGLEQESHSFFKTMKKLRDEYERVLENSCVAEEDITDIDAAAVSLIHDNSTTVGLLDLSEEIISGLLDDKSEGKMFTIMGMAGIGKTHLVRDIYNHPLIAQRFELRLWVSIGSNHKYIKNIFVGILAQISSKPRDLFKEKDEQELRDLLQNSLLHRTYLIVFDDVWSERVLRNCIDALPLNQKVHSILMTTRLYDVANNRYVNKTDRREIFLMPFLSNEESWNLFSKNVFAEKPFPTQLEKAGRMIAQICEGLPLLILVVADILSGLDQTEEYWNKVAEIKTTTFSDAYDRIYKVLVSSFDCLPQKYKPCFLYMGVFCQSPEILASKLIKLWSVEGFVEDFFEGYTLLEKLTSNSLVIACKLSSNIRIKSYKLHCTYWYVCVTEARKSKLFLVLNKLTDVSTVRRPRRLSIQNNMLFGIKEVYDSMVAATSLTRSLLFTGEDHQYPVRICFNAMLLMRVLDALAVRFYEFPNEVLNLLQLRYLALTHNGEVPSFISKLQRLRFLILCQHHSIKLVHSESTSYLPKEIWDLQELWYLRILGSNLPDPSCGVELPILSRLYVNANSCTEGVLRGTPNLEKLGIEIVLQPEGGTENSLRCLEHTKVLDRLESLTCVIMNPQLSSQVVAPPNHLSNLPRCLKKLSLKGLGYPWKYMSAIGSLPFLKVLKLRCSAFRGPEWEIKNGEFKKLGYLLLEDMDLVQWTVEGHLRWLRFLVVRHCYKLKTISYNYIEGVSRIEVDECSPSIVELAQQIKDSYPSRKHVISYSWNL